MNHLRGEGTEIKQLTAMIQHDKDILYLEEKNHR
jgi:hypothetical protein